MLAQNAAQPDQALITNPVIANRVLASDDLGVLRVYGHISARSQRNANRFYIARNVALSLVTSDARQPASGANVSVPSASSLSLGVKRPRRWVSSAGSFPVPGRPRGVAPDDFSCKANQIESRSVLSPMRSRCTPTRSPIDSRRFDMAVSGLLRMWRPPFSLPEAFPAKISGSGP